MTNRARTLVALAVVGLGTPLFACPSVPICVPVECPDMRQHYIHSQLTTGRARSSADSGGPVNFTSLNVTLLSQVPLAQMGGGTDGSSLHAWVDPLTNREYAVMGRSNGTAVIDVTNPTQPVYVANIPSAGSNTLWREPKVYGNYAYVGVDGGTHRLQFANLTQVRNYAGTPLILSYGTYTIAGGGTQITRVHTVGLNKDSGYLYLSGTNFNSGAPHIVDIRTPGSPVPAGNVPGGTGWDGYSHEAQIVMYNGPDTQHHGKEIMISSNGKQGTAVDTISVVDVSNKLAPARLSTKTYANARYIHQGWFTEDQRYFFQNDELDEPGVAPRTRTHLWDMTDLDNPVYKGFWDNTTTAIDHNLYVKGNFLYQSNYTTGLRILKIGNLQSNNPADWLEEVAWFDTFPSSDAAIFDGAWNNYPFLPSGNILVSDISGGLFVLRANLPSEIPPIGPFVPRPGFPPTLVPEPGSAGLLLSCVAGLCLRRRR